MLLISTAISSEASKSFKVSRIDLKIASLEFFIHRKMMKTGIALQKALSFQPPTCMSWRAEF